MFLYRLITFLVYCVLYPVGRRKATRGQGNELWRGRLGLIEPLGPRDIWMHASSVGEVKVLGYLIDYLKKQDPKLMIHVTVMTRAGFKTATNQLSDKGDGITLSYSPLDASPIIRRFLDLINPTLLVIAETEIWPNLVNQATQRNIPIVLVNGRMSEKAFKMYRYVRSFMKKLLAPYDRFFFKTEGDFERYRHFGVTPGNSVVVGDMKFDAPLLPHSEGRRSEMRARAGVASDHFLLVAGSTRSGEEAILANIFSAVFAKHNNFRMIIAPRHVERVGEVKVLLEEKGLQCDLYGAASTANGIILVDRMGLLNDLYMAADLAFVGGTLVDIGGHNVLEPVWAGVPVVFGPYLSNVSEAAEYILANSYGAKVTSESDLARLLRQVIVGELSFTVKTENDLRNSPTATAGDYILKRLKRA
jgi:tRNA (guanine-N7-)-methyltransferase